MNPEFDVVVDGLNLGFASARSGTWRNNRNDQNDKRALTGQYKVRKISETLDFMEKQIFDGVSILVKTKLLDSKLA